jgi:ribosomal protein S18 acetylase RimI-like enzyme
MLGTVGLSVDSSVKTHHRGFLWGMYVLPKARGQQVGKKLIQELLDRAIGLGFLEQIHLSVVTSNAAAVYLYQSMGFAVYGTDPRVLNINGEFFDEYLMCMRLDGATSQ